MIQHVVLFSFPDPPTDTEADDMRAYVAEWPENIPGIRALRFGRPLFDDRTRGYQFLLYMEFDTVDDMRSYQAHPVHQKFLAWVIDHNITPLAFDYQLDEETVIPTA